MGSEDGRESAKKDSFYKEESTKGSAGVIGFLREFNYGDRSMSARETVGDLIYRLEGDPIKRDKFKDTQGILTDLVEALEAGGFGAVGNWQEIKAALYKALVDWESHDKAWQDGVSKFHQDWRP